VNDIVVCTTCGSPDWIARAPGEIAAAQTRRRAPAPTRRKATCFNCTQSPKPSTLFGARTTGFFIRQPKVSL
jgi:hypothetical protein